MTFLKTTANYVRSLNMDDLDAIVDIEEKILEVRRPDYWAQKLSVYMANPEACVGAETDGRLVGFLFGHIKGGEFGTNDGTAWVEILGVHPDFQSEGIGRGLFSYFEDYCKKIGVHTIQTMVQWNDTTLVGFFSSLGFNCSSFHSLEKKV
ncbi:MAG: GNAT family N-acetyltransferase [Desulfocucumaceae bacterium]